DGSRRLQLTHTPESERLPRFSPDGRYLSFLSARNVEGETDQLWLMDRAGGEATRVTEMPGSINDYAWSPDSKRVVLVARDEDPDAAAAKDKDKKDPDKTPSPIVIDRFQFKDDDTGYLRGVRQHLYLFDPQSRKSECLTPGDHNEYLPAWSPDGQT